MWVALALVALASDASPARFVIAIGNNAAPSESSLQALRYADDDAVAVANLFTSMGAQTWLLSTLDAQTQAYAPQWARNSLPPSWASVQQAVGKVRAAIELQTRLGRTSEVVVFYSGHGSRAADGAALALTDGGLTQARLYEQILEKLPAHRVHLLIDACHADAVVRTRDGTASTHAVSVDQALINAWTTRNTLARFPHVGALIASSADAVSHEWDTYGSGVFTHQLVSALRGGADINADAQITYAEAQAFISAANRAVVNEHARLNVVAHAPTQEIASPLVRLNDFENVGWLVGEPAVVGHFHVADAHGARLLEIHSEPGHAVRLALPPQPLSLWRGTEVAALHLKAGDQFPLADLSWQSSDARARQTLTDDFRQGLFAKPFGANFFHGFTLAAQTRQLDLAVVEQAPSRVPAYVSLSVAALATVSAGVWGFVALDARGDYNSTALERPAASHLQRYNQARTAFWISAGVGAGAVLMSYWLW